MGRLALEAHTACCAANAPRQASNCCPQRHVSHAATGKLWPRIYLVELEEVPAAEAGAALAAARRECIP